MSGNFEQANRPKKTVIVPMGVTVALFCSSLVLALAGYGFRLMFGEPFMAVARHAMVVVPALVLGIPFLIWLGSLLLNRLGNTHIHPRNAWTLGWLLATVAMLSIMGVYS
ncbi:hypothetical protein B0181_01535 [Moraxella caviae]|uniref:Uncharacterized protein n=1 Tax=Moraxella caviae TaxID=34060 RepID=A0A1T0AAA0_9GAMM|nr:hypothetical protein [Moraxella caviae]OOR92662.1 hypothetical protein B0181_01535 [Moraxella caviae]STZ14417.1 Uncharacterised protein [Moraxella caviae]VEW10496.1 Uncharacterised protein [Moraxella caviae]